MSSRVRSPEGSGSGATLGAPDDGSRAPAAYLWRRGPVLRLWTPAGQGHRASVTVIVVLLHPAASDWRADFSAESTVSRHRCFTATHSLT